MLTALHLSAALSAAWAVAPVEPPMPTAPPLPPPGGVEYLGVAVLLRCEAGGSEALVWVKRARFNALREQAGLDRSCDAPGMTLRVVTGQDAACDGIPVFSLADLTVVDDDVAGDLDQFIGNDCLLCAIDGACP